MMKRKGGGKGKRLGRLTKASSGGVHNADDFTRSSSKIFQLLWKNIFRLSTDELGIGYAWEGRGNEVYMVRRYTGKGVKGERRNEGGREGGRGSGEEGRYM